MITYFQGPSADSVWQQAADTFRQAVGTRNQDGRGGSTKEILHVGLSIADPRQR